MKSSKQTEECTPSFHCFLPIEIIENVLSRLPVKSLIRFQSVSKSWRATISDPQFRRIHYDTTHSTAPLRALNFDDFDDSIHLVKVENKNLGTECALESPFDGSAKPGATCNGVVLMVKCRKDDFRSTVFALWNPSIRKHSDWIRPNFDAIADRNRPTNFDGRFPDEFLDEFYALIEKTRTVSYGLYHDPTTDDYKIAIVYHDQYYDVYSCKSRSWSGAKAFPDLGLGGTSLHNVNGSSCFYWRNDGEILRFDVREGKLSKIPLPEMKIPLPDMNIPHGWGWIRSGFDCWSITSFSGRLGLVSEVDGVILGVWVMEERDTSWREVVSLEGGGDGAAGRWWWPVFVTDEGDLVVKTTELSMLDCVEKRFKKLERRFCSMLPYSESLYFPHC